MKKCSCHRKRKNIAYGEMKKKYWCDKCDANLVSPKNKKGHRQRIKKEVKEEVVDLLLEN